MADKKDFNKLTVSQLKSELAERNLDLIGKKSELLDRLMTYEQENEPGTAENGNEDEPEEQANDQIEAQAEDADKDTEEQQIEEQDASENVEMKAEDQSIEEEAEKDKGVEIELETEESFLEETEGEKAETKDDDDDTAKETQVTESKSEEAKADAEEAAKSMENVPALTEEDIVALETLAKEKETENSRSFARRLMFRVGKNMVMKFLDESRENKSVLVTPFENPHLENEVVFESIKCAHMVNMHLSQSIGEFGWLELHYQTNKEASERMTALTEALKGLEVKRVENDFIKSMNVNAERRLNRTEEFKDKYKECILLSRVEVGKVTAENIEDDVSAQIPNALTVCVPRSTDPFADIRSILVEYASVDDANKALQAIQDKKITVADSVVAEFEVYSKSFQAEKADKKKDELAQRNLKLLKRNRGQVHRGMQQKLYIPKQPVMEVSERRSIGMKINAMFKTIEQFEAKEEKSQEDKDRLEIIKKAREDYFTTMRADDYQRRLHNLPHLSWRTCSEITKKNNTPGKSNTGQKRARKESATATPPSKFHKSADSPRGGKPGQQRGGRNQQRGGRGGNQQRISTVRPSLVQPLNLQSYSGRAGGQQGRQGRTGGFQARGAGQQGRANQARGNQQFWGGAGNRDQLRQVQQVGGAQGRGNQLRVNIQGRGVQRDNRQQYTAMQQQQQQQQQQQWATNQGGQSQEGTGNNPVQLLLGLSKVLSNQIRRMQGDGETSYTGSQQTEQGYYQAGSNYSGNYDSSYGNNRY